MTTVYTDDEKTWGTLSADKDKKGKIRRFLNANLAEIAKDLIDNMGANPNAKIGDWTVLELMVLSGSSDGVKVLLDRGANPDGRKFIYEPTSLMRLIDYMGKDTALRDARRDALKVLINHPDTDLDCILISGESKGKSKWKSAMKSAIETHNSDIIKDLCDAGAQVEYIKENEKIDYCKLAMHEAADINAARVSARYYVNEKDIVRLGKDLDNMRDALAYLKEKKEGQKQGETDFKKKFRVTEAGANKGSFVFIKEKKGEDLGPVLSPSEGKSPKYSVVTPKLPPKQTVGRIKKAMAALVGKETNVSYNVTGKGANLTVDPNVISKKGKSGR